VGAAVAAYPTEGGKTGVGRKKCHLIISLGEKSNGWEKKKEELNIIF